MKPRGAVALLAAVVVAAVLVTTTVVMARGTDDPGERPGRRPGERAAAGTAGGTATVQALGSAGCPQQDLSERPRRSAAQTGPITGSDPRRGRVCAYDKGRLVGSRRLTPELAVRFATAVRAGPDGVGPGGLGCPAGYDYPEAYAEPHFTAELTYAGEDPTDLWMFGNVCLPSGVANQHGRFLWLSDRLTDLLGRLVRTPEPFPLTDLTLRPGAVPTGPLTPVECPDGVIDGLPRWYGAIPSARAYGHRLATLTAPVRRAHPEARLDSAGFVGNVAESAWLLADGRRVGRIVVARLAGGGSDLRAWEWC